MPNGPRGNLKLIDATANPVPDIHGTAAALVKPLSPTKPDDLDERISDLWDEIVPELETAGMVGPMDGPTIVLALEHYDIARRAADSLREDGLTIYDAKNQREARNPVQMVLSSSTDAFLKLSSQLGLSFVARARVTSTKPENTDESPFS